MKTLGKTVSEKILEKHLLEGELTRREEIAIRIDQTLTQDATGTLTYLQFEGLQLAEVKTELSVSYIDHNTLQTGFENADDHLYLQSVALKHGILLSKPGNGICHQVHLERFARPGKTLLGSDSHTTTAGAVGMIAIGAGGVDVAVAMAGAPFYMEMPSILGVKLAGKLEPWVSAKDVILEVLRRIGVKGGVGKILEYFGEGVRPLTVPERATITNMGAETGATTSIFPSDEETKKWLESQHRGGEWTKITASKARYDEVITIGLSAVEPLVAQPHSPGKVCTVKELEGLPVHQVAIGSCTNSSYKDLMTAATILKGKRVNPDVSLVVSPGSRQVFKAIAENGALTDLISAGARILECTCGPCIGMGQSPPSGSVSIRTFNRNFEGRSGTKSAGTYLVSPEVAAVTAINGFLSDPRSLGEAPRIVLPAKFDIDDSMILKPSSEPEKVNVVRGPNIKPLPENRPLTRDIVGEVLLKVGDDVTTDHIMPAGVKILPLRSNIPAISEYVFERVDPDFPKRARERGGGIVVGGENYGQGSSREHAALAPMNLGITVVMAKSFARIHKANLVNFGILPLEFEKLADYDKIEQNDLLRLPKIREHLAQGEMSILTKDVTKGLNIPAKCDLSLRLRKIVMAGGLMNFVKETFLETTKRKKTNTN